MRADLEQFLKRALSRPAGERRAFLEAECGDAERVEELLKELAMLTDHGDFGRDAETVLQASVPGPRLMPTTIGPYNICEVLGEGGMGVVYLAEQKEPIERKLAVKVIRADLTTPAAAARFDAERQALARLSHPHIAQLFEAGTTAEGNPYFAMEFVSGSSVTSYCDHESLSVADRLRLFITVCESVHHAHQRGIIHRDLKPSNILVADVDGRPVPKVIDFGIAKAVDRPLTDATQLTGLGVMGTLNYMSPESLLASQGGVDIDIRTDVYALGVILYELLTGLRPFDRRRGSVAEVLASVDTAAPRPSSLLSSQPEGEQTTLAELRHTEAKALYRELGGELDWIVGMAIASDRDDRYGSAAESAADVKRYLAHEPVVAGPPSVRYRLSKFVRRHRALVAGAVLALFALLLGTAGTTVGMLRASAEARRANQEATRANEEAERANREAAAAAEVSDFLVGLFEVSDPEEARGSSITAREMLDKGSKQIDSELAGQPMLQARMMAIMGSVYTALGLYDDASPLLDRALELRRENLGEEHLEVAASLHSKVELLELQAAFAEAGELAREALAMRRRLLGDEHREVAASLSQLSGIYSQQGDYEQAEPLLRQALALNRQLFDDEHRTVSANRIDLAPLLEAKGDYAGAEALYREALALDRRLLGDDHPEVGEILTNLGLLLQRKNDYLGAEAALREAEALFRRLYEGAHPTLAVALNNLASSLQDVGQLDEAEALYREALAMLQELFGEAHPYIASSLNNLATLLLARDDYAGAEALCREAVAMLRRFLGDDHGDVGAGLISLAVTLEGQGEYDEAISAYQEALAIYRRALGDEHPLVVIAVYRLAGGFGAAGDVEATESHYREGLVLARRLHGDDHTTVADGLEGVGGTLAARGMYDEAESHYREALAIRKSRLGARHSSVGGILSTLAMIELERGRLAAAEVLGREALSIMEEALQPGDRGTVRAQRVLGEILAAAGRYQESETLLLDALEVHRLKTGEK